jgi:hypothetical protein
MPRRLWVAVCFCAFAVKGVSQTTARQYYDELNKAKGLDRFAEYACFPNDPGSSSFFLMAPSKDIQDAMRQSNIPQDMQEGLKGDFLYVRRYSAGIPEKQWFLDKEAGTDYSYSLDFKEVANGQKKYVGHANVEITIVWPTLRFREQITFNAHTNTHTGLCEKIIPAQ